MTKLHEFQQKPQEEQTGDNIGLLSDALKKDAESVADQWKNCSNPSLRAILSSKPVTTHSLYDRMAMRTDGETWAEPYHDVSIVDG